MKLEAKNFPARGFTLIELLVVIAVIAILAAMILPVLAKAKQRALVGYCLNDQKQLTLAWLMYAPDNDDRFVGFNCKNSWDWRLQVGSTLTATPPASAGPVGSQTYDIWRYQEGYVEAPLYRYAPNPALIHCPADTRGKGTSGTWCYDSLSGVCGLNGGTATATDNSQPDFDATPIMKTSGLKHPVDRFVFVEENDARGENLNSWVFDPGASSTYGGFPVGTTFSWVDCGAVYHVTSSTFSYADGHCASHKWIAASVVAAFKAGAQYATPLNDGQDRGFVGIHYPCADIPAGAGNP